MAATKRELTEEEEQQIIEHALAGARPQMRVHIGDRTTKQYEAADAIAEGIAAGVRRGLVKLGLRPKKRGDYGSGNS